MSFDEIPENQIEGYPCAWGGSITKLDDVWVCDRCDFEVKDNVITKYIERGL